MELARRSNTGALLAAVVVGLLGVYASHFGSFARQMIGQLQDQLARITGSADEPDAFQHTGPLSPEDALAWQRETEDELIRVFQWVDRYGITTRDRRRLDYLDQRARFAFGQAAGVGGSASQAHAARERFFVIAFLLAEIEPARFSQRFLQLDASPVRPGDPTSAVRRTGLRLYHQLRAGLLDSESLIRHLRGIRQSYPNDPSGVQLHSILADELRRQQMHDAAHQVLEEGIRDYTGRFDIRTLQVQLLQSRQDLVRLMHAVTP